MSEKPLGSAGTATPAARAATAFTEAGRQHRRYSGRRYRLGGQSRDPAPSGADQAAPAKAENDRPLIRPDTSEAERNRLQKVYMKCLTDNGLPRNLVKMSGAGG